MKFIKDRFSTWTFISVVVLDQITKFIAVQYLSEGIPVKVIPNFFSLTLVYNPGAAFGIFATMPDYWRRMLLLVVSGIALLVVFYLMLKEAKEDFISRIALSAILAGAVGNLIDRARIDSVVDFLDCYYKNYHWPAFNIADSAICIGVSLLVLRAFFPLEEKACVEEE